MSIVTLTFTALAQGEPAPNAPARGFYRVTFPSAKVPSGGPAYWKRVQEYEVDALGKVTIPNIRPADELNPPNATLRIEVFTSKRGSKHPVASFDVLPLSSMVVAGEIDGDKLVPVPGSVGTPLPDPDPTPPGGGGGGGGGGTTYETLALPWDLPVPGSLFGVAPVVMPHYWPANAVSFDNKATPDWWDNEFLVPGKNGSGTWGSYCTDRPIPRAPLANSTIACPDGFGGHTTNISAYRVTDKINEIRTAEFYGYPGFWLNMMVMTDVYDSDGTTLLYDQVTPDGVNGPGVLELMYAAKQYDSDTFKIGLMFDCSGNIGTRTPEQLAAWAAGHHHNFGPWLYHLPTGEFVVNTFYAQLVSVAEWQTFLNLMSTKYGIPTVVFGIFSDERTYMASYDAVMTCIGNWGNNSPAAMNVATYPARWDDVKALGQMICPAIRSQDNHRHFATFDEALGSNLMRNCWDIVELSEAEYGQIPTWNDYTEYAHISPSIHHGYNLLDLHAYRLAKAQLATQSLPPLPVKRDGIYLWHRTQFYATPGQVGGTMSLRGGSSAAVNKLFADVFVPEGGADRTVTLNSGPASQTFTATAAGNVAGSPGWNTFDMPLSLGEQSAVSKLGSVIKAATRSPHQVVSNPYQQDLAYKVVSSFHEPMTISTDTVAPSAPTGITVTRSGSSAVVGWTASTDNVAVTGYDVHRSNTSGFTPSAANIIASVPSTSVAYSDPAPGTGNFYYKVIAKDAAANRSVASAEGVVNIPATAGALPAVYPNSDCYINAGAPSGNFSTTGMSAASAAATERWIYMEFDVPACPAGMEFSAATLDLTSTTDTTPGSADTFRVAVATAVSDYTTFTWSGRAASPEIGPTLGTFSPGAALPVSTHYSATLDPALLQAYQGTTVTLVIKHDSGANADPIWIHSVETATTANKPHLSITTAVASGDVIAPSTPGGVVATVTGADVSLTWPVATDNVGVTAYEVHRSAVSGFTPDGTTLIATPATNSYSDTARPAGTYYYKVKAKDAAGNKSLASGQGTAVVADTTAPTVPGTLSTSVSGNDVTVDWADSTDAVGVAGYDVHRSTVSGFTPSTTLGSSTLVGTPTASTYADTVPASGTYYYKIVARDAAGNASAASAQVSATVVEADQIVALSATGSTYVNQASPTTVLGAGSSLSVAGVGTAERRVHIEFDVPVAPAGKTLQDAKLEFWTNSDAAAVPSVATLTVSKMPDATSDPATMNWNTKPSIAGATAIGTFPDLSAATVNTKYEADLDNAAVAAAEGGSLALVVTANDIDSAWFWSSNYANPTFRPVLRLTYHT